MIAQRYHNASMTRPPSGDATGNPLATFVGTRRSSFPRLLDALKDANLRHHSDMLSALTSHA